MAIAALVALVLTLTAAYREPELARRPLDAGVLLSVSMDSPNKSAIFFGFL